MSNKEAGASGVRLIWGDVAKGLGIILVVFGHMLRGIHERGLLETGLFSQIDARIYAFHMPLFFLLSGLFFLPSLRKTEPVAFLRSRVWRLLYPMVLWTYIFIAFKVAAGSMSNSPVSLDEFLVPPIPGRWHFWFLWALFVIQISMLAVRPLLAHVPAGAIVIGLLVLSAGLLLPLPLPDEISRFFQLALRNLPFFVVGMVIGQWRGGFEALQRWAPLALALFAALIWAVPFWPDYVLLRTVFSVACCLALLLPLIRLGQSAPARFLASIGVISLPIYLAHTIFSAGIREVLLVAGVQSLFLQMLLGTLIGLVGPAIVWWIARRLQISGPLGLG